MQIQDVRRSLTQRREELRTRVNCIDSDLRRESDPLAADFADQAVQRANDPVLGVIGLTAEDELHRIEAALQRIDAARYDVCAICGGRIAMERLEAVPYTDLCAPCALGAVGSLQK